MLPSTLYSPLTPSPTPSQSTPLPQHQTCRRVVSRSPTDSPLTPASSRISSKPASASASKPASKNKATSKPATKPKPSSKDKDDKEPAKPSSSKAKTSSKAKPAPKVEDKPAPVPKPKVNGNKRGASEQPKKEVIKKRRTGAVINPLAQPDPQELSVFVWGTGDNGQFGTGADDLDEKPRPQLNNWYVPDTLSSLTCRFEERRNEGKLGAGPGKGGLETVAAGGMHNLGIDELGQVRSWGINDGAALGRITADVPDPSDPKKTVPFEELECQPLVVEALKNDGFRAVKVAAGDSVSIALNDKGDLRAWGSFRVSRPQGDQN